ncbi:hypothetical protein SLEP1_g25712 [Rubroshorea leprosula]|nr:hypothetical protein SLEP1_g25712 [Rubroshorea leprosula]
MLGGQVSVTSYYCAVTIEDDVVIIAFRLSKDRRRSLVEAILPKVKRKTSMIDLL